MADELPEDRNAKGNHEGSGDSPRDEGQGRRGGRHRGFRGRHGGRVDVPSWHEAMSAPRSVGHGLLRRWWKRTPQRVASGETTLVGPNCLRDECSSRGMVLTNDILIRAQRPLPRLLLDSEVG